MNAIMSNDGEKKQMGDKILKNVAKKIQQDKFNKSK